MLKISAISDHHCHLGEGPVWDWREETLWWVDSLGPVLYQYDFHSQQTKSWSLSGSTIGSLAVCESGGLILAMDLGFYSFNPQTTKIALLSNLPTKQTGIRLNDGKVDPNGNFIAGTMNIDHDGQENCRMYRLDFNFEVTELLDGFSCFNGPCFSLDGNKIYLTGRKYDAIEVFEYDPQQKLKSGLLLIDGGIPDGATVDEQGYIWSAQWTQESIIRISPDGNLDAKISVPGQIVSSVMFGGPDLDLIYVTTAGGKVGDAIPTSNEAGKTLVIQNSGYKGRAESFFKG